MTSCTNSEKLGTPAISIFLLSVKIITPSQDIFISPHFHHSFYLPKFPSPWGRALRLERGLSPWAEPEWKPQRGWGSYCLIHNWVPFSSISIHIIRNGTLRRYDPVMFAMIFTVFLGFGYLIAALRQHLPNRVFSIRYAIWLT